MTRQAAPPARRWLFVLVALLVAPWLGQGVAVAYSMSVTPQSGPAGTHVTVNLSDFGTGCVVSFDGEPVAGVRDCEGDTTLVFDVPTSASTGSHEVRADGVVAVGTAPTQSLTFRVTAGAASTTAVPVTSPPVSTATGDVAAAAGASTTVAGPATTRAGSSPNTPTTAVPVAAPASPGAVTTASRQAGFAAGCQAGQVALMRFAVAPTRARAGGAVTGSTSWGSVGTCSDVRDLRVILDGKTVPGTPPAAGTSGKFEMSIPRDATPGPHTLSLVADDDPSIVVATVAFQVEKGTGPTTVILGAAAAGAVALLVLFLLVRRRRRRKRGIGGDDAWADDDGPGGWDGFLDVPDIVGESEPEPGPELTAAATAATAATAVMVVEDHPTMPVVPLVVSSGRHGSYYLLERQNPHAPRQANGKRGWYRDQRTHPIRGIVVDTVEPHTAGAAASEMATGEKPASAHVVVDIDGALDLLPDDVVAVHRPGLDEATLVMLLAGVGRDAVTDEVVLGHAAAWAAAKMADHAVPARLVTADEFEAGRDGLLSGDAVFLWHRIVNLVDDGSPGRAEAPPPVSSGTPTFDAVGAADAVVTAAVAAAVPDVAPPAADPPPAFAAEPADPAPSPPVPEPIPPIPPTFAPPTPPTAPAAPTPPEPSLAAPPVEPAPTVPPTFTPPTPPTAPVPPESTLPAPPTFALPTPPESGLAVPTAVAPTALVPPEPAPPVPPTIAPPALPEPDPLVAEVVRPGPPTAPAPPRPRRPLPPPDELIAQVSADPTYFLVEHENPHATLRANGKHGWYYPTRYGGIRAVVLYTVPGVHTADGVAEYLAAVDQPDAAHAVVDPDVIVELLPDDATALHGVRSSSAAIDLALAYDPSAWGTDPARDEALLVRAATWVGVRAVRHGIPVRRITVDQWHTGQGGIATNADVDPGPDFPWDRFLQLTAWVAGRVAASQPTPTSPSETVRSGNRPT